MAGKVLTAAAGMPSFIRIGIILVISRWDSTKKAFLVQGIRARFVRGGYRAASTRLSTIDGKAACYVGINI